MTRFSAAHALTSRLAIVGRAAGEIARRAAALLQALEHRREVRHLAELDERILKDIGLSRSDVDSALAEPLFRHPSVLLVRSVERRSRQPGLATASRTRRPTVPMIGQAGCSS
jgi:uncharacterized protein YjiS (DUF1127 family)